MWQAAAAAHFVCTFEQRGRTLDIPFLLTTTRLQTLQPSGWSSAACQLVMMMSTCCCTFPQKEKLHGRGADGKPRTGRPSVNCVPPHQSGSHDGVAAPDASYSPCFARSLMGGELCIRRTMSDKHASC